MVGHRGRRVFSAKIYKVGQDVESVARRFENMDAPWNIVDSTGKIRGPWWTRHWRRHHGDEPCPWIPYSEDEEEQEPDGDPAAKSRPRPRGSIGKMAQSVDCEESDNDTVIPPPFTVTSTPPKVPPAPPAPPKKSSPSTDIPDTDIVFSERMTRSLQSCEEH